MLQLLRIFNPAPTHEESFMVHAGTQSWSDGQGRGAGYQRNWAQEEQGSESYDHISLSSEARYLSSNECLNCFWTGMAA